MVENGIYTKHKYLNRTKTFVWGGGGVVQILDTKHKYLYFVHIPFSPTLKISQTLTHSLTSTVTVTTMDGIRIQDTI